MKIQHIDYKEDDTILEGYLAYEPDTQGAKKPAVIIAHAWGGRDQFVCQKAESLAKLGYVGFALDIYGKGKLGTSVEENTQLMTPFMDDRQLLRKRLLAAFETVAGLEMVDANNIGAMGFCFGGLCVLDLARSGADVKGVVSLHGLLSKPNTLGSEKITAKILALHGHDDPMVPPDQVLDFEQEMSEQNIDWQVHVYGQTQHAFTNPEANDPNIGTMYSATADRRAWQSVQQFFAETLNSAN